MKLISNFFLKNPANWKFWLLLAVIFKGLLFVFCIYKEYHASKIGTWWGTSGDTNSYLWPIENLVDHGKYYLDYRMPGYGIFYLPLYFLFPKVVAINILLAIQLIVASISNYLLALIARKIFKTDALFYLTFYLYGLSIYSNMFDETVLTESFTTSFFIISIYFFIKFFETKKVIFLIIVGGLLADIIFMRPVFFPTIFFYWLILIFQFFKQKKSLLKFSFLLFIPFVIFESSWIIRNYVQHNVFAPFFATIAKSKSSYFYPNATDSGVCSFLQSFGGNIDYSAPNAEIRCLGFGENSNFNDHPIMPSYIYTSKFNADSVAIIRKKFETVLYDTTTTQEQKVAKLEPVYNELNSFAASIKKEKPFVYYLISPAINFKRFFVHSGTYNLFAQATNQLNLIQLGIKIFYTFFYWFVFLLGVIGIFMQFRNLFQMKITALMLLLVGYTGLIHPIVLRVCEVRYFVPMFPFVTLFAAYALWKSILFLLNKFSTN